MLASACCRGCCAGHGHQSGFAVSPARRLAGRHLSSAILPATHHTLPSPPLAAPQLPGRRADVEHPGQALPGHRGLHPGPPGTPRGPAQAGALGEHASEAPARQRNFYTGGRITAHREDSVPASQQEPCIHAHLGACSHRCCQAHNSHLGDARATDMGQRRGEINIGQLMRETYGEREVYSIGWVPWRWTGVCERCACSRGALWCGTAAGQLFTSTVVSY